MRWISAAVLSLSAFNLSIFCERSTGRGKNNWNFLTRFCSHAVDGWSLHRWWQQRNFGQWFALHLSIVISYEKKGKILKRVSVLSPGWRLPRLEWKFRTIKSLTWGQPSLGWPLQSFTLHFGVDVRLCKIVGSCHDHLIVKCQSKWSSSARLSVGFLENWKLPKRVSAVSPVWCLPGSKKAQARKKITHVGQPSRGWPLNSSTCRSKFQKSKKIPAISRVSAP